MLVYCTMMYCHVLCYYTNVMSTPSTNPSIVPTIRSPTTMGPTPEGVPVMIKSPGCSAKDLDNSVMISGTFQIIFSKRTDCLVSPLTVSAMVRSSRVSWKKEAAADADDANDDDNDLGVMGPMGAD